MKNIFEWSLVEWVDKIIIILKYLLSKWLYLLIGCLIGLFVGYWKYRNVKTTYTATISFVLSTESSKGSSFSGLAAQLGLDAGTGGVDNIFSGDNIIELFKSQKMVRGALLNKLKPGSNQILINYIALKQYPAYKNILPFPADASKFNNKQDWLFKNIATAMTGSFTVFKKDKKLIFYIISATSNDSDVAYYTAKCLLNQTSQFFIQTKISAATKGLNLLKNEADSLSRVISGAFQSTAATADRTYNINPSLMIQRSNAQYIQAKSAALTAAYIEVMRNLELAKINVQKETPLFGIIDEPDLPLPANKINLRTHIAFTAFIGFFVAIAIVLAFRATNIFIKIYHKNAHV